jgi:hypothetical protein
MWSTDGRADRQEFYPQSVHQIPDGVMESAAGRKEKYRTLPVIVPKDASFEQVKTSTLSLEPLMAMLLKNIPKSRVHVQCSLRNLFSFSAKKGSFEFSSQGLQSVLHHATGTKGHGNFAMTLNGSHFVFHLGNFFF